MLMVRMPSKMMDVLKVFIEVYSKVLKTKKKKFKSCNSLWFVVFTYLLTFSSDNKISHIDFVHAEEGDS